MPLQEKEVMLTTEEAAELLKLAPATVRQYVRRGLLKPRRRIGQAFLFLKSECDRYAKQKKPRGNPNF